MVDLDHFYIYQHCFIQLNDEYLDTFAGKRTIYQKSNTSFEVGQSIYVFSLENTVEKRKEEKKRVLLRVFAFSNDYFSSILLRHHLTRQIKGHGKVLVVISRLSGPCNNLLSIQYS